MSMRYPGGLIATSPVNARYPSGVWTQAQAAPYQAQNVWTRDQFWPNTTLLLQGDGAVNGAQNNTFLDSSSNNFTITRNGNTTQGSFTPYEQDGYWSNYFGGSGDFIYVADSSAFTLGSGDFTVEAWVWTGVTATQKVISGQIDGSGTTASLSYQLELSSSDFPRLIIASGGTLYIATSSVTLPKNQWVHLAGVRDGSTLRIYVNGVQYGTQSVTGVTVNDSSANVSVGRHGQYAGLDWNGYISNFRLVKGTCVYPNGTTFTPSTAPLTAITNTSLLTCQSNRFKDNSTNAFAITVNGSPSVQAFQPFPGATTWSASVLGGSGYFDGSGDFLATPSNVAFVLGSSGDFTVECWMYPIGTQSLYSTVVSTYTDFNTGGGYLNKWHLGYSSTTTLTWYDSAGNAGVNSTNHPINSWSHVAVVRSGSTITMYVNGASVGTQTTNQSYTSQSPVQVGFVTNAAYFNGYISNVRVVKGSAVYTSNFTPPTAPLTAITNTSLLLSTTNAGIYDNSMMNNLETVGNAQVSTSVVKYGTGSMAFDGSGDRLVFPFSPWLQMGSGDWTIEMWLYINAAPGGGLYFDLYTNRASVANFSPIAIFVNDARKIEAYFSTSGSSWTSTLTTTGVIATGTWTHVAVVRSGSTVRVYFNGTADATTATISGALFSNTSQLFIGGEAGGNDLNGYLDDFRITKGAARYITTFTPPPARLPAQ